MHKTCPLCGYVGAMEHCPNDGEPLLTAEGLVARTPPSPTQAPPREQTVRAHAKAAAGDSTVADGRLRDENFGQWDAPAVRTRSKTDPMLGRLIEGRYEIIKLVGKGGMGAVYKARQTTVQRDIALKVLLEEFVENDVVVQRFYQEALAASRLKHPNTIEIYDFGQTEDHVLYIAMEYLQGLSLAQALARTPRFSAKRTVHIMRQVCKSLAEAHQAGIIHRDLKPDNIFLTDIMGERDFVKVLDFGVAKLKEFDGKEGTLTQAGMIFGTPKYMSPEQARSAPLDARSDVYALGVILYEMLTGEAPFVGDNPLSILIAHVNEHATRFAQLKSPPDVPAALEAVVFRAMAKHPDGRQPDTESLLAELDAIDAIDALLDGADYTSVADQLPQMIIGADGQPSMVGPAILPIGSDGTVEGVVGGNTEVLLSSAEDADSFGNMTIAEMVPPEMLETGNRRAFLPLLVLLLGIPAVVGGVWFATQDDPIAPDAAPIVAVVQDATPPRVVDAGAPDAVRVAVVDAAVKVKEIMVASEPTGARIIDVATGEKVGVTYARLSVSRPTVLRVEKSGYTPQTFSVNPDDEDDKRIYRLVLKAKAERPKPPKRRPRVTATSKSPGVRPATRAARPHVPTRPATAAELDPIELQ